MTWLHQSKSTDTVETVSPQSPKEKEKHGHNQGSKKPVKLKENVKTITKSQDVPDNGKFPETVLQWSWDITKKLISWCLPKN